MGWARVEDGAFAHPKFLRAGLAAQGLWLRALSYAAHYETDGHLPRPWVLGQLATSEERKLPARLVECGLWQEVEDGWVIHDYLAFNLSKAEWAKQRAQKSEAGKKGARSKWHGTRHGERLTEPEPEPDPDPERPPPGSGAPR